VQLHLLCMRGLRAAVFSGIHKPAMLLLLLLLQSMHSKQCGSLV
jgi:hypothetical protein